MCHSHLLNSTPGDDDDDDDDDDDLFIYLFIYLFVCLLRNHFQLLAICNRVA